MKPIGLAFMGNSWILGRADEKILEKEIEEDEGQVFHHSIHKIALIVETGENGLLLQPFHW